MLSRSEAGFKKIVELQNSTKTKYRIVFDGYVWCLQYYHIRQFLFFRFASWEFVLKKKPMKKERVDGYNPYTSIVCSLNTVVSEFVRKWPDVQMYFLHNDNANSNVVSIGKNAPTEKRSLKFLIKANKAEYDWLMNGV